MGEGWAQEGQIPTTSPEARKPRTRVQESRAAEEEASWAGAEPEVHPPLLDGRGPWTARLIWSAQACPWPAPTLSGWSVGELQGKELRNKLLEKACPVGQDGKQAPRPRGSDELGSAPGEHRAGPAGETAKTAVGDHGVRT